MKKILILFLMVIVAISSSMSPVSAGSFSDIQHGKITLNSYSGYEQKIHYTLDDEKNWHSECVTDHRKRTSYDLKDFKEYDPSSHYFYCYLYTEPTWIFESFSTSETLYIDDIDYPREL
jgi:hypothetical protein